MNHSKNLVRIKAVYNALGPLKDQVVFVGGATVPGKQALLAYRELVIRMLSKTGGAYQRMTEASAALQQGRLDLINEALNMYYK
jgi:hypothetical protein